jgi:hypothetical protein
VPLVVTHASSLFPLFACVLKECYLGQRISLPLDLNRAYTPCPLVWRSTATQTWGLAPKVQAFLGQGETLFSLVRRSLRPAASVVFLNVDWLDSIFQP